MTARRSPMTSGRALIAAAKRCAIVRTNHFSTLKEIIAADDVLYRKAREFVHAEDARLARRHRAPAAGEHKEEGGDG